MSAILRYAKNVLVWLDQGVNVLAFAGNPAETLSSRAGKLAAQGIAWPARIIDAIFGRGHCAESILHDRDNNIDRDKRLHTMCGFFVCLLVGWFVGADWGMAATAISAVGKEIYDYYFGGDVDIWDIWATLMGGLVAYTILLGVGNWTTANYGHVLRMAGS